MVTASGNNIVVVTFNYRVGPYGFLTDGGGEIEPNNGLFDQRKVMQWVQDQIALFGGVSGPPFLSALLQIGSIILLTRGRKKKKRNKRKGENGLADR